MIVYNVNIYNQPLQFYFRNRCCDVIKREIFGFVIIMLCYISQRWQ